MSVAVVSALVSITAPGIPRAGGAEEWTRPVPGGVVAPFQEPPGRYAAGHRGVDFAAAAGTSVKAANDGRVSFAGVVAGSTHVVVSHDGGIRTSYSYLATAVVSTGQMVKQGQIVGTAGGSGEGHGPGVLHFGVRVGDRYVDPMLLFSPPDLTKMVNLVPADERAGASRATAADERKALEEEDDEGDCAGGIPFVEQVCDVGEDIGDGAAAVGDGIAGGAGALLDAGLEVVAAAGKAADRLARALAKPMHDLLELVEPITQFVREHVLPVIPGGVILGDLLEIGERLVAGLAAECDHDAPPANGKGGSGNAVVMIGGFDSHRGRLTDARGRATTSFGLPIAALGYEQSDVHSFSYRAGSETYAKVDTHQSIARSAELLARQLRDWKRENPGRSFDLIAHSQGGVVVLAFLAFFYIGHESDYPPIASIVTFASPLEGVPMSTLVDGVQDTTLGATLLWALQRALGGSLESALADSVNDLAENSDLMRALEGFEIPESINWTSIMGTLDPIVVASSGDHPGVDREVPVTVGSSVNPFDDHTGILTDGDALAVARAGIEGRDPPCQSIGTIATGAAAPVAIARLEHTAGDAVATGLASPTDLLFAPLVP